ncbi:MAG: hypothetical protein D8M18_06895 [Bacteroidetes bacterium]|nr:hypothetical protein [Bacteroidota bacterium]MCL4816416.1 hypothetical protein [Flavobacteriales bacterium]
MNLITENSLWLSLLCVLLGVFYSILLYYKSKIEMPAYVKMAVAFFRFILVSFLAFLLLNPLLKILVRTIEKPIIVFAHDNSQSLVLSKDSSFYQTVYKEKLARLKEKLEDRFEVQFYSFGESVWLNDSLTFTEKTTDISSVIEEVTNKYSNRNLGAFILASDGIFNKGENPLYANYDLTAPLYTIALGDTAIRKDMVVKKVYTNRFAYLGNKFPVQIDVKAHKCRNETTLLKIIQGKEILHSKTIEINNNDFFQSFTFLLEANKKGIQRYRVVLEPVKNEISLTNNTKDFLIEIIDGRQKILILANAPHPDIAAIKQAIDANINFETKVMYADEVINENEKYNLCILHQLPSTKISSSSSLIKKILNSNTSLWYIIGTATNLNDFNTLNSGISITPTGPKLNNATPILNTTFSLFTFGDENKKILEKFPPLYTPFGNYKLNGNPYVFLKQKIGSVKTETPLFVFSVTSDRKTAVTTGEGVWRWRIYNYKEAGNYICFNEMVSKTVQFLSVHIDKSRFKVVLKDSYLENEPILIEAESYNESFELVNENEVQIVITDSKNKKYPFTFSKTTQAYFLNAGILPVGNYTYKAVVKSAGKELVEQGSFTVDAIQIESVELTANHNLLYALSERYNGGMYMPKDLEQMYNDISSRKNLFNVSYSENKFTDIINMKWVFFVLMALVSIEWFFRKYFGGY